MLKIPNIELRKYMEVMKSTTVSDFRFFITGDGLWSRVIDGDKVSIINGLLRSECFDVYDLSEWSFDPSFEVRASKLVDFLNKTKGKDVILSRTDEPYDSYVRLKVKAGKLERAFSNPEGVDDYYIDAENVPSFGDGCHVNIDDVLGFHNFLKHLSLSYVDVVRLSVDDGKFMMRARKRGDSFIYDGGDVLNGADDDISSVFDVERLYLISSKIKDADELDLVVRDFKPVEMNIVSRGALYGYMLSPLDE